MAPDSSHGSARLLIHALQRKDPASRAHSARVAGYAVALAHRLGVDDRDTTERLILAALLHDVGNLALADGPLARRSPVAELDPADARHQVLAGAALIEAAGLPREVASWVRHHHERHDGTGGPDGLAADAIPLASRILAVAEALEELTGGSAYRPAVCCTTAHLEIRRRAGAQFDPEVVAALATAASRGAGPVHPLAALA